MGTNGNVRMMLAKRWGALVAVGILFSSIVAATPAAAADATLSASIDGRAVARSKENRPVRLRTERVPVDLEVTNRASSPITASTVRFSGRVMGLTFFAYETSADIRVNAGATESRRFVLDLGSLKGQATGLLLGSITLLDGDRQELASQDMVVDVRGSVRSVYGTFGLLLAVLTGIALALALRALALHRLSSNRWARALRFLGPGIGLGLVFVIGFSILRIFAPRPARWAPIMIVCAGALFLVGYLSPSPEGDDQFERDGADDEAGRAVQSGATSRKTLPGRGRP